MLQWNDIEKAIDAASGDLTSTYPEQGGYIASLGAKTKDLLRSTFFGEDSTTIDRISRLFEMCPALDENRDWNPHPDIASAIEHKRGEVEKDLLQLFYRRKIAADLQHQMQFRDERGIALRIAQWLPAFRAHRPRGMIGPAWLAQNLDQDFWEELQWYTYDEERKELNWNRFMELLPSDVTAQFDPSLVPIDIPERLANEEEAIALLMKIGKQRGMTLDELTDLKNVPELYRTEPAFKAVIEYFRSVPEEEKGLHHP